MLRGLKLKDVLLVDHDSRLSRSCPDLLNTTCLIMTKKKKSTKCRPVHSGRFSVFFRNYRTELVEEKDASSLDFVPWLQKDSLGGSMEQLLNGQASPGQSIGPFRRETGDETEQHRQSLHALLENPESETRWYFKYFLGKFHQNFLCYDSERNPCFLSVTTNNTIHRCIMWRKTGNKRLCIKCSSSSRQLAAKTILEKFNAGKYDKTVREITSAELQKDLLTLEEQEGAVSFKVGVVYAKAGQTSDVEMLRNKDGSPAFTQFLDLLGDTITLKGWQQYKGGLDTRCDATGSQSVYTVFEGHEIMFHVSTMLPYTEDDEQQLERKRHIGNDIVTIIFFDGDIEEKAYESALYFYPAASFKSHFNHIFALVTYSSSRNAYRLVVHSAKSIPEFGPPLPPNGEFIDHQEFRDFLLAKLINGEKAAYCIPTFTEKRVRTLEQLIKASEQKYLSEARRSLGAQFGPGNSSPSGNRKYFEMEQKFTEVGQKLKVQKIELGHHPHSKKTTALQKQPWEVFSICEDFPYKTVCGDVCGDDTLIVATQSDGTYLVFANGSMTLVIDRGIPIGQISVAHKHQLLMFRTAYQKESNYFYAVPLDVLFSDRIQLTDKSTIAPFMLPYTKGCHLFCTSELDASYLKVVVAAKNKITMLVWKYHTACPVVLLPPPSPMIPGSPITSSPLTPSPFSTEGFVKHRELTVSDTPVMMTLLDVHPSGKLCLAYQKSGVVEAVDEVTTDSLKVLSLDPVKTTLTVLHSFYQSGRGELLVGHNMTSQTLTINEGMTFTTPEIVWNSEPKHIAIVLPYVFAFTTNAIEIRMAANGSLMHTLSVPDLHLITSKGDIIFSSSAPLKQSSRLENSTQVKPEGKLARVLDKKPFIQSSGIYIYKIMVDSLLGRKSSSSSLKQGGSSSYNEDTESSESRCSLEDTPHTLLETSPPDDFQHSGSETPPSPATPNPAESFSQRRRRSRQIRSRPRRNMRVIPDGCEWANNQAVDTKPKNGFAYYESKDSDSLSSPLFDTEDTNLLTISSSSTPSLL